MKRLSKIADRVMNGQGLIWKSGRFAGRQAASYVRDFGRATLFVLKSLALTAVVGTGFLGVNTAVNDGGYQFTFPQRTLSMVSASENEVTITDGQNEMTFVLIGAAWLDSEMGTPDESTKELLNRCLAYQSIVNKDSSREEQLTKPTLTSTNLIPNSIEYISSPVSE